MCEARIARGRVRGERMAQAANRRIVPAPEEAVPAAQIAGESRIGRVVRRPAVLDL